MGSLEWVVQNLGLMALTIICAVLVIYLGYCMVHPERF
jgi:hypothetical protein